MRRAKIIPGILFLLSVLAVAGYLLFIKKTPAGYEAQTETSQIAGSESAASGSPEAASETAPLLVKAVTARRGDLVMTLKSPGEACTERKIVLKMEVGGAIKNLFAREGLRVREGDVLVEIDDAEYRLSLEKLEAMRLKYLSELHLEKQYAVADQEASPEALANLARAQAEHEAALASFRTGKIAAADLERTQRAYELALIDAGRKKDEIIATTKGLTGAEIDVKSARRTLEKTILRAPFSGILTDLKVSPRERIEPGREICTLVDLSQMKVRAKVLESEIRKMKPGRQAALRFSAYPDKVFHGLVESVGPIVDAADKTCPVFISVVDSGEEIKPGMYTEVEIAAEIYPDRLLVPQDAILVRGGRKLVFIVDNGTAKWRYVEIGLENEHFAEILPGIDSTSGISEGDTVIVEGHFTLAHDSKVVVR
ncbi:MAG: efflux RND transporter periplasmic adaptor subunit [Candidatus Aminicenantes bacterium]|nr:efflux RND transporter periplasmic adaptor subunit [Candidatus Aminicenantes bacterium]